MTPTELCYALLFAVLLLGDVLSAVMLRRSQDWGVI